jgi:hypothetical protein
MTHAERIFWRALIRLALKQAAAEFFRGSA